MCGRLYHYGAHIFSRIFIGVCVYNSYRYVAKYKGKIVRVGFCMCVCAICIGLLDTYRVFWKVLYKVVKLQGVVSIGLVHWSEICFFNVLYGLRSD